MGDQIEQDIPVVLLWLEEGLEPSAEMFGAVAQDLTHGPDIWPHFDQAFRTAMNTPRTDERLPWIKVGDRIVGPEELRKMYVPDQDEASRETT